MARPVKEAENRLAHFNRDREGILGEVERRVLGARLAAADAGEEQSLEYVLNEVAYAEIRRLERGPARPSERRHLGDWQDLAHRLGGMTQAEKRARLTALVRRYAQDVCGNFDSRVYRFATTLLPPVLHGILQPRSIAEGPRALADLSGRVLVDGPIEHLRTCADRGTLVVTPTHSSHMDSVVLGWSLFRAGLPPCTYGAGKNLFTNPFMSFFMRNLGAYRVDRRIQHALYKDVLKTYATVLLERGYHSLFFPGGTRTRSGGVEKKLKMGLLGTAITAYEHNIERGAPQRRIYVVPATINYAIVLEAETLVEDYLAEEGKHRYIIEDDEASRLGRIVDFSRRMLSMEGSIVIRYGTPLDPFGNRVDEEGESRDPRGRRVDPAIYVTDEAGGVIHDAQRDAEYTRLLGDEITRSYRKLTVYLPTHLVARALWDRLAATQGSRDVYRLLRNVEVSADVAAVAADVTRLQLELATRPDSGAVADHYQALSPEAIVEEAVRMFLGYHSRPVVERVGDRLIARDLRLLFYYQNRMAHFRPEASS